MLRNTAYPAVPARVLSPGPPVRPSSDDSCSCGRQWELLIVLPIPSDIRRLLPDAETGHTPPMTLKNAAFLALIGTALLTILMAADFINTVLGVARDVIPAMALLRSLVYLLASLTATVFFYVFNRA